MLCFEDDRAINKRKQPGNRRIAVVGALRSSQRWINCIRARPLRGDGVFDARWTGPGSGNIAASYDCRCRHLCRTGPNLLDRTAAGCIVPVVVQTTANLMPPTI